MGEFGKQNGRNLKVISPILLSKFAHFVFMKDISSEM